MYWSCCRSRAGQPTRWSLHQWPSTTKPYPFEDYRDGSGWCEAVCHLQATACQSRMCLQNSQPVSKVATALWQESTTLLQTRHIFRLCFPKIKLSFGRERELFSFVHPGFILVYSTFWLNFCPCENKAWIYCRQGAKKQGSNYLTYIAFQISRDRIHPARSDWRHKAKIGDSRDWTPSRLLQDRKPGRVLVGSTGPADQRRPLW